MEQPDYHQLTAPCGLDCFNCEIHVDNITGAMQERVAASFNRPPEDIPCRGCRSEGGCKLFQGPCDTLRCVQEKGVSFCFECDDFPCTRLQPALDGAERYPHNLKMYNLCRIKNVGVAAWAEQEASSIRIKYSLGTFVPGDGPSLIRVPKTAD